MTQYTRTLPQAIPEEGELVVAKGTHNGKVRTERCIYENGRFVAGGDFPIPPYALENVIEWVRLKDLSLPLNVSEIFRD